jgi:hypothetical protein
VGVVCSSHITPTSPAEVRRTKAGFLFEHCRYIKIPLRASSGYTPDLRPPKLEEQRQVARRSPKDEGGLFI